MSNAKSAPLMAGVLLGVVVALLAVVAFRDGSQAAYAQSAASGPASVGTMTMVSGMSQQNLVDLVYVLSVSTNGTNKQLAVYHCRNGQSIKLIATRDITWDLQVPQMGPKETPSVLEIKDAVEKELQRKEKELKDKLKGAGTPEKP
jgi:hypothetical protein